MVSMVTSIIPVDPLAIFEIYIYLVSDAVPQSEFHPWRLCIILHFLCIPIHGQSFAEFGPPRPVSANHLITNIKDFSVFGSS